MKTISPLDSRTIHGRNGSIYIGGTNSGYAGKTNAGDLYDVSENSKSHRRFDGAEHGYGHTGFGVLQAGR